MQVDLSTYMEYIEIHDIGDWRIKKGTPERIAERIKAKLKTIKDYEEETNAI